MVGLALIYDQNRLESQNSKEAASDDDADEPISRRVEAVTRALGPFLVPMIDYLGGLDSEDVLELAQAGDED